MHCLMCGPLLMQPTQLPQRMMVWMSPILVLCAANSTIPHVVVNAIKAIVLNVLTYRGRTLCPRCAKSRLFFTTGSHGPQGPEFCTLQPLLAHQGFFVLV